MKRLLLAVTFIGLAAIGLGSVPPAGSQRAPLAALDWIQRVTLAVASSDSGAVITLTADNPEALQAVRDYVAELTAAASLTSVDPVCGMQVNRAQAREAGLTAPFQERTYSFCSAACRGNFLRQPARFAAPGYQPKPAPGGGMGGH